jgi:dTDP-glucose pyrophosphorylase
MIIIPMAGYGTRFSSAGYTTSKYLLLVSHRPLLYWILKGLNLERNEMVLFVFGNHNSKDAKEVSEICKSVGIENFQFLVLAENTRGQAHTIFLSLEYASKWDRRGFLIFNADTVRPNLKVPTTYRDRIWVETFEAAGEHWSFVSADPKVQDKVAQIAEKQRISNLCCTGAYYFPSHEVYSDNFTRLLRESASEKKELYVSLVIQQAIENGEFVSFSEIEKSQIFLSGTPHEYERLKQFAKTYPFFCAE